MRQRGTVDGDLIHPDGVSFASVTKYGFSMSTSAWFHSVPL